MEGNCSEDISYMDIILYSALECGLMEMATPNWSSKTVVFFLRISVDYICTDR